MANSVADERIIRGADVKMLRGIFQPIIPFRLSYIKKYDIIIIYKRRIINDNKKM